MVLLVFAVSEWNVLDDTYNEIVLWMCLLILFTVGFGCVVLYLYLIKIDLVWYLIGCCLFVLCLFIYWFDYCVWYLRLRVCWFLILYVLYFGLLFYVYCNYVDFVCCLLLLIWLCRLFWVWGFIVGFVLCSCWYMMKLGYIVNYD